MMMRDSIAIKHYQIYKFLLNETMAESKAQIPKIYGALAEIMKESGAIGKTERNQGQGFMFRGIDNVMNGLHGLFAKHGVLILDEVLDFEVNEKVTEKTGSGGQRYTSILYYTRAKIKFHFLAEDGSEVTTINVGEAMDSGDKGMNKAMSVALKYALLHMFLIPTEEEKDPDAQTPPETRPKTIAEIAASLDAVKDAVLIEALNAIVASANIDALKGVWSSYSAQLSSNPTFSACMSTRKKELGL